MSFPFTILGAYTPLSSKLETTSYDTWRLSMTFEPGHF